jgi:hypothetical protein
MTQLGVRLADIPRAFGWDALCVLRRHAPMDSALMRWLHKDEADYSSDLHRAAMLADIFDAIQRNTYADLCIHSKQRPKEPKRYPRPWLDDSDEMKVGASPIPVSDFNSWYYGD